MKLILALTVLTGSTLAAPAAHAGIVDPNGGFAEFLAETNAVKKELEPLSNDERSGVTKVFDILADTTTNKEQKMQKINEFTKDLPQAVKDNTNKMAEASATFTDWLKDRLKTEDPAVANVANGFIKLMLNVDFIMSPDENKKSQAENLIKGLNPQQVTALEQIEKDIKAKEKEFGISK